MKYRIVKKTYFDSKGVKRFRYECQKRGFIFWNRVFAEDPITNVDLLAAFDTFDEAKDFIYNFKNPEVLSEEVVWKSY